MAPAEKEPLDGAAVITGGLGRDQILQCLVVRLRNVRSEMWNSRLWSKTGPELTLRQLGAFLACVLPQETEVCSGSGNLEVRGGRGHSATSWQPSALGEQMIFYA